MPISVDVKGINSLIKSVQKNKKIIRRASMLAANDAAKQGVTLSSKEIKKEINLTPTRIKKSLFSKPARSGSLEATLGSNIRGILLFNFQGKALNRKGKPAGVSVKVKTKGGTVKLRSAFFTNLNVGKSASGKGAGSAAVFQRISTIRGQVLSKNIFTPVDKKGRKKEPIAILYGPSIYQIFRRLITENSFQRSINTIASRRFIHHFNRLS